MARATLCDRCQHFEDGEPIAGVTFTWPKQTNKDSGSKERKDLELCSSCLASLHDWTQMLPTSGLVEYDA